MTQLKTVLLLAAAVVTVGCGGKKDGATTTPTGTAPAGGTGDVMQPGGPTQSACATELALECAAGAADGCLTEKTNVHVCVTADSKAGPPCEQEIMLNCAQGQFDACGRSPALAANHICVFDLATQ